MRRIQHWNWTEIRKNLKLWILVQHIMKKTADTAIIFKQTSCKKFHLIKSFSVCVFNVIHEKIKQRTTFLHWLSSFECNHNSKLILNFLDSRNIKLTLENMIFYKTWYHCCFQSNLYMRRWWKIHCILNMIRFIWIIYDVFWFEEWIQHLSILYQ